MKKATITIFICLLIFSFIFISGCTENQENLVQGNNSKNMTNETPIGNLAPENNSENIINETPNKNVSVINDTSNINSLELEKQNSFFQYYKNQDLKFEAAVPTYSLPLNASEIANYDSFIQKVPLTNESRDLLYKNGFVVLENGELGNWSVSGQTRVNSTYKDLKVADVPIFITSDSLLHLYHIQYDETLKRIESEEFYDELWKLDEALLEASIEDYESTFGRKKEAARRNVAYFSVALKLLEPDSDQIKQSQTDFWETTPFSSKEAKKYSFEVPSFVKTDVEAELSLIETQEEGISPIFKYWEDYSQYTPRGHYTSSEKLKNYFKAMMWHGRISMLLNPEAISAEDPEKEAKIQTIQALLISDHFDKDKALQEEWNKIYEVTAFYVGYSDDLGPYEYTKALDTVFGENRHGMNFDNESLVELKYELERYESPKIYGGTGQITQAGSKTENETLEATKGFKFMGQRYTPDSYILQKLNPPALNIMDLLGSERAKEHLKNLNISENEEYKNRHTSLENEFGALDEEAWNKNLYWAQLYALKPLLVSSPEGYPTFMQTKAWEDKQLNTALASWTELRHDTILYAKQDYYMGTLKPAKEKPVQGYVEPVPEFYARMLALTKMAHNGLKEMEVLNKQSDKDFTTLENTLEKLRNISIKELENKELTDEEYEFIRNFDQNIAPMLENIDIMSQNSILVADVGTSPGGVLEEGTGKLDLIVVAYKQPDGRIVLGAGPVMSYYEFLQSTRLTDEEWGEILKSNPPERPEWISSYKA